MKRYDSDWAAPKIRTSVSQITSLVFYGLDEDILFAMIVRQ